MSYLDDLKKKAQGVVDTVQNVGNAAYNGVKQVYNATQNAGQNIYNAATGNTQQKTQAQQTQAQNQQTQAQAATQPPAENNWVADYEAFENDRTMNEVGQGVTSQPTQSQDNTQNTAQSGLAITQNANWQNQLDDVMNKIMAGEKFNYDMNSDAMYQQYRDIYENQANMAMQNAMAQNAALTGGYGSSYGQMVGQQAYAQQMQGLNEIGLGLYDRAYNQYQNEQNNLYNQQAMLAEKEALDYNREYQANRDTVADQQWQQSFDYQKAQDEIAQGQWQDTFDYQKEQDALAQKNYENEFAYQQGRDEVADEQWLKQYEQWEKEYASSEAQREADNAYRDEAFQYQQSQDKLAQENYQNEFEYQQAQDKLAQENWQAQFDETVKQNEADNAYRNEAFDYQKEMDKQSQANYEKEFEYQQSQDQQSQDNWLKQYEQWEKEYASSEEQRALDNQYRDSALEYQKEQDAQSQANWQASMDYQKEMDKQSQSNWQAEFDREDEWYNDAQEAAKPTTKYEGESSVITGGTEVPKQLANVPGLTTTNPNFFDEYGNFKNAAIVKTTPTGDGTDTSKDTVTYNLGGEEIELRRGYSPYTKTKNPDANNGTFNGYQPDNIGGEKLSKRGRTDTINGVTQNVWETPDGNRWIWDATQNKYLKYGTSTSGSEVAGKVNSSGNKNQTHLLN